ncbi:cytochrome c oxidase subunit II [Chitinivorax sp. B]|uniref:cytochrome c oxidase subunit II n=1 Tax=Chitinivorax sp. B TaxID=2502235 RepID=UPI0010F9A6E1|nr:cytochrome c oxidase subunit II [Chitinivorax sp. B]
MADYKTDMQAPANELASKVIGLHELMLYICGAIFVAVFGVMFYSIFKHRKSAGHKAANFHENATVEVVWTIVPLIILVLMALPATKVVLAQKDTKSEDLTIKVTGYQWKWGYDYLQDGVSFYANLSTPRDQIEDYQGQAANKGENYLLEVDNHLVVPVDKKIRLLLTANDVIHSWWVPAFAVKQDAIPGLIRDTWFKVDKPGIYRGQCAELCGKDHGFMPIVVEAKTQAEYDKWLEAKKKEIAAQQDDPNKVWKKDELMARGEKVYNANCVACHQASGQGVPGTFPSLVGSKITVGPAGGHIDMVLNGKAAMPPWKHLSDTEIAAVVTYERNAWGNNKGDLVQPSDVKAARK